MERRSFLKTSALAAGVSLLDACGGEEIQYLIQPLEQPEARAGVSLWKTSVCGQCAAGCGTVVRVVDGEAKKVEGLRAHPINHGGLCALGQASLQGYYNPDRVTKPMRRRGNRGSELEEISWEDALGTVAEALGRAAAKDPGAIAFVEGSGESLIEALLSRLAAALSAPPPSRIAPLAAEVERRAAEIVLGNRSLPAYDLARADYVLSIGPAFLDRWHQPAHGTWAMGQLRGAIPGRRGKLVQAEARMSLTAAFADEWLPVSPGQEGTLARAIGDLLLESDAGVGEHQDAYRALFPEPGPPLEEAAQLCDLPASTIRRIATELASADSAVVLAGGTAALGSSGLFDTTSALALNWLVGAVERTGGVFPSASTGLGAVLTPAGGELGSAADFEQRLLGRAGAIPEVVLVCEADPLHSVPKARGWRQALAGVEHVIALTAFLDDTALEADLILPTQVDVERFRAAEPVGLPIATLSLAEPAVRARGAARHPGDIILALGTALGHEEALPWESYSDAVKSALDARQDELTARGFDPVWAKAVERGGIWGDSPPTGQTVPPTTAFEAPTPAKPRPPGRGNELTLLPFESPKYGDGRGANRPWLQELPDTLTTVMWDGWAELATADAERLGIRTGDLLSLSSDHGSIQIPAILRPEARPGTVAVPLGMGHADFGRYAKGRGANPLDLVAASDIEGTRQPVVSGIRVLVERLGPGELALFGRGLREAEEIPTGWAPMASHEEKV